MVTPCNLSGAGPTRAHEPESCHTPPPPRKRPSPQFKKSGEAFYPPSSPSRRHGSQRPPIPD